MALSPDTPLPATFAPFLMRVYPTLAAQLEANLSSRAFDDYGLEGDGQADAIESLFALCHTQAVADLSRSVEEDSSNGGGGGRSKKAQRGARGGLGLSSDGSGSGSQGGAGVLGLSWSCNGSVVAAAYGCSNHSGWCNHSSATIAFWNIMRRQISSTAADFTVDTDCCCMCLAYHPERPTILAGGMFNGEIRVWDTSLLEESGGGGDGADGAGGGGEAGNPLIMRSSIDDYYHREPVARLQWVRDGYTRAWNLASVAGDGKVLFWPAGAGLDAIAAGSAAAAASATADGSGGSGGGMKCPIEGYVLQPNQLWHGQGVQRNRFQVLGGAAVAFVQQQPALQDGGAGGGGGGGGGGSGGNHYFVAATEGGGIVRVALSTIPRRKGYVKGGASDSLRWNRDAHRLVENSDPAGRFDLRKLVEKHVRSLGLDAVELEHVFQSRPPAASLYPSAINMAFEGHAGPAYGLEFNPHERRIFASAATDGHVKIFHTNNVSATVFGSRVACFTGANEKLEEAWRVFALFDR